MIVLSLLILACSIYAEMSGRYRQSFRKHYGDIRVMWHTWKGYLKQAIGGQAFDHFIVLGEMQAKELKL